MNCGKAVFTKPPLKLEEQLVLLERRGLAIENAARARSLLEFIGYYRLAAYGKPYQRNTEQDPHFIIGTRFDDIVNLYIFDRQLRLIVIDAIERIEVAVRAVINDRMSLRYGSQWYTEAENFKRRGNFNHLQFMDIVKKGVGYKAGNGSGPAFCKAYFEKYSDPVLPPSWMVTEVLSIGTWSRVYSTLSETKDRKYVCSKFNVRYEQFGSWLHAVSFVRNICAHHAMLWNLRFTIKPKLTHDYSSIVHKDRFYAHAVVIQQFLKAISPKSQWKLRLKEHIDTCPLPTDIHMGFPANWHDDPWW